MISFDILQTALWYSNRFFMDSHYWFILCDRLGEGSSESKQLLLVTDVSPTWAEVIFRVKWIVFVTPWSYKSGPLKAIGQLERFSFECRKAIGFGFCMLHDWLKKLAPLFHPIRSKTKTNPESLTSVFPRFASASCNYFEFWLVHWIVCVLCDWLE